MSRTLINLVLVEINFLFYAGEGEMSGGLSKLEYLICEWISSIK